LNQILATIIKRSLIFLPLDEIGLLEVPVLVGSPELLAFAFFLLNDFLDLLALVDVLGVEVLYLFLLVQFHIQLLLLHALLVGQAFGQVVPLELRQVLQVPHVL
jgi:hypothetical protein